MAVSDEIEMTCVLWSNLSVVHLEQNCLAKAAASARNAITADITFPKGESTINLYKFQSLFKPTCVCLRRCSHLGTTMLRLMQPTMH